MKQLSFGKQLGLPDGNFLRTQMRTFFWMIFSLQHTSPQSRLRTTWVRPLFARTKRELSKLSFPMFNSHALVLLAVQNARILLNTFFELLILLLSTTVSIMSKQLLKLSAKHSLMVMKKVLLPLRTLVLLPLRTLVTLILCPIHLQCHQRKLRLVLTSRNATLAQVNTQLQLQCWITF